LEKYKKMVMVIRQWREWWFPHFRPPLGPRGGGALLPMPAELGCQDPWNETEDAAKNATWAVVF